jgi:hypothetical protein
MILYERTVDCWHTLCDDITLAISRDHAIYERIKTTITASSPQRLHGERGSVHAAGGGAVSLSASGLGIA